MKQLIFEEIDEKSENLSGKNIEELFGKPVSARSEKELEGVSLLGAGTTKYPTQYDPTVLETFVNKHQDNDYVVTFDAYEGSSLCPKTHQPDFFKMVISYIPDVKMVESKSLKLYLFSFRNTGSFHEDIVNTVMKDLVKLMDPKYLEVTGIFSPRGGISIFPFANYCNPKFPEYESLKITRFTQKLSDGSQRNNRYDR